MAAANALVNSKFYKCVNSDMLQILDHIFGLFVTIHIPYTRELYSNSLCKRYDIISKYYSLCTVL